MQEVGSMSRVWDVVLDSLRMVVDVYHTAWLVFRVDYLVTCNVNVLIFCNIHYNLHYIIAIIYLFINTLNDSKYNRGTGQQGTHSTLIIGLH